MSKPIAAARSNWAWLSLNVPCRSGRPSVSTCAPQDRGKNSYQELNSARLRSTQTVTGSEVVISSRIGLAVSVDQSSSASAGPMRSVTDLPVSRSASIAARIAAA